MLCGPTHNRHELEVRDQPDRQLVCAGGAYPERTAESWTMAGGVSPRGGCTMIPSGESQPPDRDVEGGEDPEEDPGEELEAMIEQADRPFASESFGTTAEEQEEGESLDQKLGEERPTKPPLDRQLAIEDFDAPDEEKEMVGLASVEHD